MALRARSVARSGLLSFLLIALLFAAALQRSFVGGTNGTITSRLARAAAQEAPDAPQEEPKVADPRAVEDDSTPNVSFDASLIGAILLLLPLAAEAGDSVVEVLSHRCDATEKRSVDEVAIDLTSEAERLLATRSFEEDLGPSAARVAHLADSALSRRAANATRNEARMGHEGQQQRAADALAEGWEDVLQRAASDPIARRLIAGAVVVAELRGEVESKLGFTCSGGVATNKILAKLGCGLHKPNQQTLLLPHAAQDLPLDRLPGLGGDFGSAVKSRVEIETAGELLAKRSEVMIHFPDKGEWLLALAAGSDKAADPVKDRQLVKSLSNGKTFFGSKQLRSVSEVDHWLGELAGELHLRYVDQVSKHQRAPTTIGIHVMTETGRGKGKGGMESAARQQPIDLGRDGSVEKITAAARACFRRWHGTAGEVLAVTVLGLSLTNIVPIQAGKSSLTKYFEKTTGPSEPKAEPAPKPLAKFFQKAQGSGQAAADGTSEKAATTVPKPPVFEAMAVDESVLAELPLNLQEEIRRELRLGKRPSQLGDQATAKRARCEIVEIDE
eukprot:s113_g6.t1